MKERIAHICSLLPRGRVYADVGCDHGYMAQFALEHGLCERIYITDIHAASLKKAETLLSKYIEEGRCMPVVCDGLRGVKERCDFVLIAGMGGEEIVKILQDSYMPARFLLQPMKNSEKLRRYLVGQGAVLERDYTFSEGNARRKYYDIILGRAAAGEADPSDAYSEKALRFGRDNLEGASRPFLLQMREELEKTEQRLQNCRNERSRKALEARREEYKEIIHEVERTLRRD